MKPYLEVVAERALDQKTRQCVGLNLYLHGHYGAPSASVPLWFYQLNHQPFQMDKSFIGSYVVLGRNDQAHWIDTRATLAMVGLKIEDWEPKKQGWYKITDAVLVRNREEV